MAGNIKLEVVTPEKSIVDELVEIVVAPGTLGEFGVLSGHTPFLTALKTGFIRFSNESSQDKFVFISGGFAEALPNKVTVLAESAERKEDINISRARKAVERANNRLLSKRKDVDFDRVRASLIRAKKRIELFEMI